MQLYGRPKANLRKEALEFINLFASLGERAEVLLPKHIFDNLKTFIRICYEEPDDPARQQAEIQKYLLQFREEIPGYVDVSLMLYPHENSKAFVYNELKDKFRKRLQEFIDNDSPLVIANADQFLEWNSNEFFYSMMADECDGGIVTFTSSHPKWSYVKTGEHGFVTQVAEKKPISNTATAGIYYYKKGSEFVRYAQQMINKKIAYQDRFYVAPVYNEMIYDDKKIRIFHINKIWGFKTPEDVNYFLTKYSGEA